MKALETDIAIVGAGPVGLMCAYLAHLCGLRAVVLDKSAEPLRVGRADALNARTLQLLEIAGLFDDLYPLGKICNTSSVWAGGGFVSRQSKWWDALEGCFHKHFLMLGQPFVEQLLDRKLQQAGNPVRRCTTVSHVEKTENGCLTTLGNGETIASRYVIGADGSRSFIRELFKVPFEVTRPQIIWAVLDGVIESDFPKVPEIITFQTDTSDVAWIPREGDIDRFYVRMDTKDFTLDQAIERINRAMQPHTMRFKELVWFSAFSVKESVAERFSIDDRIFLAGDASHIHSVNGGMGLNTGLSDAFNLIWKMHRVLKLDAPASLLRSYEEERKPVALGVVETSGQLVRSTKFSKEGTHAKDYVDIVERRSGYVTGMGVRYGEEGMRGTRLQDFMVETEEKSTRIYSLLDYAHYTLLTFGDGRPGFDLPVFTKTIRVPRSENCPYHNQALLVRPDGYIADVTLL
ncbi:FAD-binding protein [bacterium]|nr:FAD-binding protein [bacterium]